MLSINIPVYNIEVSDLVADLIEQGKLLKVPFEIRVYDDGSHEAIKKQNRKLKAEPEVVYTELPDNLGRAAIRNRMGNDSIYQNLLFIDADSKVVAEDYLKKYFEAAKPDAVICGGTTYQTKTPAESEKLLRWTYGIEREAIAAQKRSSAKGFIITSNNFLINKEVFQRIHFREELKTYGHEDTLLGYDLHRSGISIQHIDNPLEHTGLEDAETFLSKTKMALENLKRIAAVLLEEDRLFTDQMAFLRTYRKITRWIPPVLLRFVFKLAHPIVEKNLKGKNPSLFLFDLYKLSYFAQLKNR